MDTNIKNAACAKGTCSHCTCQQRKLVEDWGFDKEAVRLMGTKEMMQQAQSAYPVSSSSTYIKSLEALYRSLQSFEGDFGMYRELSNVLDTFVTLFAQLKRAEEALYNGKHPIAQRGR